MLGEDLEIGHASPVQGRVLDRVASWGGSLITPLALELDRDNRIAESVHYNDVRAFAVDPTESIWIITRQDLTEPHLCKSTMLEAQDPDYSVYNPEYAELSFAHDRPGLVGRALHDLELTWETNLRHGRPKRHDS